MSRKSLSIYLYTRTRPPAEIAPPHATFYVQRPMPGHIKPGYTLTSADVAELSRLFARRDQYIQLYQKMELKEGALKQAMSSQIEALKTALRPPLTGYVTQKGPSCGYWPDGWISPGFEITISPQQPVTQLIVKGYLPKLGPTSKLSFNMTASGENAEFFGRPGEFEWPLALPSPLSEPFRLAITAPQCFNPRREGINADERDLLFVVREISCLHH